MQQVISRGHESAECEEKRSLIEEDGERKKKGVALEVHQVVIDFIVPTSGVRPLVWRSGLLGGGPGLAQNGPENVAEGFRRVFFDGDESA